MPEKPINEHDLISRVLRVGIILTSLIVLVGAIIFLLNEGTNIPNYSHFQEQSATFRTLSGIIKDTFSMDGEGIIQLGLVLLIFVPFVRVAVSVYTFYRKRDWLYVIISFIVLCVLLFSLIDT